MWGGRKDGGRVRCRDHLPPHRYTRNTSTRGTTPTEHLLNTGRRPQTSQKAPGAAARSKCCASEVGEPTSGHWSTRELPAPHNIKWRKSPRDLHLNTSTQLQSTTSKLTIVLDTLCQTTSKTGTQTHPLAERLPKIIVSSKTPQNTPPFLPTRKTRSSLIHQNTGTSPLHQEAYTTH